MKPIGGLIVLCLLTAVSLSCLYTTEQESEREVVPPPGIRAAIPTDFPEAEARVLRALAISSDDLPSGFELAYEDASRESNGLIYVAHYFNSKLGATDFEKGGLATADIVVLIFYDMRTAEQAIAVLASMNESQLIDYTQEQRHWSSDPSLAEALQQVGVTAEVLPQTGVASPSIGWLVSETVRDKKSKQQITFYDLSIAIRRGRIVAVVDLGSSQVRPNAPEVAELANMVSDRISVLR